MPFASVDVWHDLFLLVAALRRTVLVSVTRAIRGGTGHTIVSTIQGTAQRSFNN